MDYYSSSQQPDCRNNYLPNISYYVNEGYLNQPPPFINQLEPINPYAAGQITMAPTTTGVQQHHKRSLSDVTNENGEEPSSKKSKPLNPFAPECSIPLPYQLGDEYGYYGPVSIWKRNERERHRVRCVNDGYEKLRSNLPFFDKDKRLSKVETLRLAIRYIRHLQKLLANENHNETCNCQLEEHAISRDNNPDNRKKSNGKQRTPCSDDSDFFDDSEF